jgi:hypothetical protein
VIEAALMCSLGVAAVPAFLATDDQSSARCRIRAISPYQRILNVLRSKFRAGSLSPENARRFGIE